jgi:phosphoglycolate phosphatase-like HAD superfamily hydrolase
VTAAVDKVSGAEAVMVGDSTWDVVSAGRAGVPVLGVLTGGFSREELRSAGAVAVYDGVADLLEHLDDSPLGRPGRT